MTRDGYDFYEVKVLNAAFKKAVELANAVGSGVLLVPRSVDLSSLVWSHCFYLVTLVSVKQ